MTLERGVFDRDECRHTTSSLQLSDRVLQREGHVDRMATPLRHTSGVAIAFTGRGRGLLL